MKLILSETLLFLNPERLGLEENRLSLFRYNQSSSPSARGRWEYLATSKNPLTYLTIMIFWIKNTHLRFLSL